MNNDEKRRFDMRGSEMLETLAARTGVPAAHVMEVLKALADELDDVRRHGKTAWLPHLGMFRGVRVKARVVVSPNGVRTLVPRHKALKFYATAYLRGLQE